MSTKPTIFISICSYRDPMLKYTVDSLLSTKSNETDIVISILDQSKNPNEIPPLDNIIYKQINPEYSNGMGWARHLNSLNLTNEDFYYQIDSHDIFDNDWDIFLVNDYIKYSNYYNTNKVILTSACKEFIIDSNNQFIKYGSKNDTTITWYQIEKDDIVLTAHSGYYNSQPNEIIPAIHIHGGNLFTHSDYIKNIGLNPYLSTREIESYTTLIAFAHDYKLCHHTKIFNYHLIYNMQYYPTKLHVDPVISLERQRQIDEISLAHWKDLIENINPDILERYREYSGIDYINRQHKPREMMKLCRSIFI